LHCALLCVVKLRKPSQSTYYVIHPSSSAKSVQVDSARKSRTFCHFVFFKDCDTMLDQIMWLFTVPVLKIAIKVALALCSGFLIIQVARWYRQSSAPNPFEKDDKKPRRPYIVDQKKRDAVLKQSFTANKVPDDLDAIIVGSGIGGLTTGAIMAKAGKRVLILEQHDQAGGCCHTYIDKGYTYKLILKSTSFLKPRFYHLYRYEFDVGIHYIGKLGHHNINKTLVDQVCEGQLEWAPLEDDYDVVTIGYGDAMKRYPVNKDHDVWKRFLKKQFPDEEAAIDQFFELLKKYAGSTTVTILLKVIPLWVAKIVCFTPILGLFSKLWSGENDCTTLEVIQRLTSNKDLQTCLCYCWGDYGTPPAKSHFTMQVIHFFACGSQRS
jgi:all-trans-retinol 13,14-reductase